MDWEELAKHDSIPHHPWTPKKVPFPTPAQRENVRIGRGVYLETLERMLKQMAARAAEEAKEDEVFTAQPCSPSLSPRGAKRPFPDDGDDDGGAQREASASPSESKKRKMKGTMSVPEMQPMTVNGPAPPKQYPAPRTAYSSAIRSMIPDQPLPRSGSSSCAVEASASDSSSHLHPSGSMSSGTPLMRKGLKRTGTVSHM